MQKQTSKIRSGANKGFREGESRGKGWSVRGRGGVGGGCLVGCNGQGPRGREGGRDGVSHGDNWGKGFETEGTASAKGQRPVGCI